MVHFDYSNAVLTRSEEAKKLRDPKLNGKGVQQAVDLRNRISNFRRFAIAVLVIYLLLVCVGINFIGDLL
jgi:hypothetical protein